MYALVEILYEGNLQTVIFGVGMGYDEKHDDDIFFYVDSEKDLEALKYDNAEDFKVVEVYDITDNIEEIL